MTARFSGVSGLRRQHRPEGSANAHRAFRTARSVACLILCFGGAPACSVVDQFAGREVAYDTQAEQVRDESILLNIVRASYRRPMLFIDVGPVTGVATASATGAFSFPLWQVTKATTGLGTFSPSGTVSGGPSFLMTPLVSKEFYSGIMNPNTKDQIAYLISEGISKREIFLLALQRITVTVTSKQNPTKIIAQMFVNDFYKDKNGHSDAAEFLAAMNLLIRNGLTVRSASVSDPFGPPISADRLVDLSSYRDLPAGLTVKRYTNLTDDKNLVEVERKALRRAGETEYFRLEKQTKSSNFCFQAPSPDAAVIFNPRELMRGVFPTSGEVKGGQVHPTPEGDWTIFREASLSAENLNCSDVKSLAHLSSAPPSAGDIAAPPAGDITDQKIPGVPAHGHGSARQKEVVEMKLDIEPRSPEQIIYYLGELTRARRARDRDDQQTAGPYYLPKETCTQSGCLSQDNLMNVKQTPRHLLSDGCDGLLPSEIATCYGADKYTVAAARDDYGVADRSFHVLSILSQLLALNNSAKDLPSPGTVTLVTH